jgi:hypothetical protein
VRKANNLPPSCADVKKSGGLNLLEPCGPVQTCNGTAFTRQRLLRAGRSGDRISVGTIFSVPSRPTPRPTQPAVKRIRSLPMVKTAEAWCWPFTSSRSELWMACCYNSHYPLRCLNGNIMGLHLHLLFQREAFPVITMEWHKEEGWWQMWCAFRSKQYLNSVVKNSNSESPCVYGRIK